MTSEGEESIGDGQQNDKSVPSPPGISIRKRVLIVSLTWIIALVAALPAGCSVSVLLVFPADLLHPILCNNYAMALPFGYCVYLAVIMLLMIAPTRRLFFALYIIFVCLLLFNIMVFQRLCEIAQMVH